MRNQLPAYPRTLHLGTSGGGTRSHAGLFFDEDANLVLFHRSTILKSPPRDSEFLSLYRQAHVGMDALWETLQDRYVLY